MRRRACDRVSYPTSRAAKTALAGVRSRRGRKRHKRESGTYKCRRCGEWHLTSHRK